MEVVVDDTQLSLAIGKKGQNVRLAAKLLGWKVDIKSEEEKRQEVESQMAALVIPGAPVSVLLDHDLSSQIVEKLLQASIPTVERLGAMTPEELEAVPGIAPEAVEEIRDAVLAYYSQYDQAGLGAAQDEESQQQEPTLEMGSDASGLPETEEEPPKTEQDPEESALFLESVESEQNESDRLDKSDEVDGGGEQYRNRTV